ncbi:hypothetical protein K1719_001859 [Acacia pycnantha]|nr:hypothetical protein K1719_001859 [Acacia pycnantha]
MYPFERFLRTLKQKIKNPRYVEGSIVEAYLVEEAAKFASYYYPPEMMSRWRGYFSNSVRSANPSMSESEVDQFMNSEFQKWLRSYFVENPSDPNEVAWSLSYGAAISVTRCKKYIINGKGDHSTMRRLIATLGKKVVPPIHQSGAPEILRHGSFGSVPTASDLSLIMR